MKKIYYFYFLLATTLLSTSCTKDKDIDDSVDTGIPAVLTVNFTGDDMSKATLPTPADESKIGTGIVLVFKGTGANPVIDGRATFDFLSGSPAQVSVNITAGSSRHVYVVANVDPAVFNSVTKVSDLYNITTKYHLTAMRTGTNLAMSGSALNVNASAATPSSPTPVSVTLKYIGSRIHIDWDLASLPANLNTLTITGAYLLNVKSESDYFSSAGTYLTTNVNKYLYGKDNIVGFTGTYLPQSPATNTNDTALKMSNLATDKGFDKNYFYVLENNSAAHTIVVLEASFGGITYYYPIVINGDQNGSGTGGTINPGDKSSVVSRGNLYNVKAIIKGLGGTDPYEPIVKGAMTITIVPASWNPVIQIDQEFN